MTAQAPIEEHDVRAFSVIIEQQSQEDNNNQNPINAGANAAMNASATDRLSPDLAHLKQAVTTEYRSIGGGQLQIHEQV